MTRGDSESVLSVLVRFRRAVRRQIARLDHRFGFRLRSRFCYRGDFLVGRDVPDVAECHSQFRLVHSCPQDDGRHVHEWVRCLVTDKLGNSPREANRCRVCGARRCDMDCIERRHHIGPHQHFDGEIRQVGA